MAAITTWLPGETAFLTRLAGDVRYVLHTHLHIDHAGKEVLARSRFALPIHDWPLYWKPRRPQRLSILRFLLGVPPLTASAKTARETHTFVGPSHRCDTIWVGPSGWSDGPDGQYETALPGKDTQQVGANTVITLDANDSVTLTGVQASHLTASNFKFT